MTFSNVCLPQVGNKADLTERREVELETATEFARQNNIPYIETSVIGRSNIKVSLTNVISFIL